ncbi:biopolymer transporter ExbD [Marinobacter sp. NSM]|uniref:biopolymer transporter ExbD n=1 Tax=Marinobacter sp. NSM TaxID=3458004 RepID=UPI0040365ACA
MLTTRLLPVDYLELGNDTSQRSTTEGDPRPELRVEVDGRILWQDTRYSLQELVPALTAAGVSEANLEAAPEASLASFTRTLSTLDNAGITPHWKRSGTPES